MSLDLSSWEATPITEEDLRTYLKVTSHPTSDFDVIPKFLFNFDTKTE